MPWENLQTLPPASFRCGHCGHLVGSVLAYRNIDNNERIHVCPQCSKPSYFTAAGQMPGIAPGADVAGVPDDVRDIYKEARDSAAANAFTGSVLLSRKLLMNVAVAQGAKEGLAFIAYVEYLAAKGYVPPHGKGWVDHIRSKGNEATHEIKAMTKEDAEELITFSEMLLKFIYEFPSRIPKAPQAKP